LENLVELKYEKGGEKKKKRYLSKDAGFLNYKKHCNIAESLASPSEGSGKR